MSKWSTLRYLMCLCDTPCASINAAKLNCSRSLEELTCSTSLQAIVSLPTQHKLQYPNRCQLLNSRHHRNCSCCIPWQASNSMPLDQPNCHQTSFFSTFQQHLTLRPRDSRLLWWVLEFVTIVFCLLSGEAVISCDRERIYVCFRQILHWCPTRLSAWSTSGLPLYI